MNEDERNKLLAAKLRTETGRKQIVKVMIEAAQRHENCPAFCQEPGGPCDPHPVDAPVLPASRVVHWKREPYDVYVGRPTLYGNPFSHENGTKAKFKVATREEAIAKYEEWVRTQPGLVAMIKRELRGKVLGCWCSPKPCHAEVLVRIANEEV